MKEQVFTDEGHQTEFTNEKRVNLSLARVSNKRTYFGRYSISRKAYLFMVCE